MGFRHLVCDTGVCEFNSSYQCTNNATQWALLQNCVPRWRNLLCTLRGRDDKDFLRHDGTADRWLTVQAAGEQVSNLYHFSSLMLDATYLPTDGIEMLNYPVT